MELANLFSRRFAHTRLYETDRGVWIRFDPSQKQINLGTVHFNENDRKLYAIEEIKTLNILPNATKCHVALEFREKRLCCRVHHQHSSSRSFTCMVVYLQGPGIWKQKSQDKI